MDIKDAIARLDPDNDAHWTGSGLPSVDAVASIAGGSVTRKEIAAAMPGFDRDAARLGGSENAPAAPDNPPADAPDDAAPKPVKEQAKHEPANDEAPDAITLIEVAIAAANHPRYLRNSDLQNFVRHWQVAQHGIKALQARLDARRR